MPQVSPPQALLSADENQETERLRGAVSAWSKQNLELRRLVEALEQERNFYFGKLREIELLCDARLTGQDEAGKEGLREVQRILYKAD